MCDEVWRNIPGFPGYEASSEGRIRSLRKVLSSVNRVTNSGYETVCLWLNKKCFTKSVHWCVLSAFEGDQGLHINHKNGNKRVNRYENLEWVTRSENMKHAFMTKLLSPYDRSSTKNPRSKLSELQIHEIKSWSRLGITQTKIAKNYGVDQTTISNICRGKTHV